MSTDQIGAEALALEVLAWLAGTDDMLEVFMGATGLDREGLRTRLAEPEFLAAVLDFVMMDEAWVMAAAGSAGVPPEAIGRARRSLPGGAVPDWT